MKKTLFLITIFELITTAKIACCDKSREIEIRITSIVKIFERPEVTAYLFKKEKETVSELLQMSPEERAALSAAIPLSVEAVPMIGTYKSSLTADDSYKSICIEIKGKLKREIDRYALDTYTMRSAFYDLRPETKNIGVDLATFLPNSLDLITH